VIVNGETKVISLEEISAMILGKMKEIAESYWEKEPQPCTYDPLKMCKPALTIALASAPYPSCLGLSL
jgi:hypothetical protein